MPAGEKVGRRQPSRRQIRAVRSAADGPQFRWHASPLCGFDRVVRKLRIVLQHLFHIEVAELAFVIDPDVRETPLDVRDNLFYRVLLSHQALDVEIAEKDLNRRGLLGHSCRIRMDKSFAFFGRLGPIRHGRLERGKKIAGCVKRIYENTFGRARMCIFAVECDGRRACRPRLVRYIAKLLAIDRIGKLRSPFLDLKFIDAAADLFIRRKGDSDVAVL